jgi:hypothetical protein
VYQHLHSIGAIMSSPPSRLWLTARASSDAQGDQPVQSIQKNEPRKRRPDIRTVTDMKENELPQLKKSLKRKTLDEDEYEKECEFEDEEMTEDEVEKDTEDEVKEAHDVEDEEATEDEDMEAHDVEDEEAYDAGDEEATEDEDKEGAHEVESSKEDEVEGNEKQ